MAEALVRANAELTETRELLAENSRIAERLRIRAICTTPSATISIYTSLQLDVASRLSTGKAAEHILQAHAVARLLLGDVRDVVTD